MKTTLGILEKEEKIKVTPGAMGTLIEAEDLGDIFKAVEKAHNALLESGVKRVVTEIKIDDRRDKDASIKSKTKALG